MPKIPSCLALLLVLLLAHPASAIVTRHDRDDARYVELGAKFPAAATVLPDGSGVLIAPEWVLTAGHVARGVSARSPRVEIDGREYEVARIFVHPEWTDMGPHDVALLQLKQPAEGVTPVALYAGGDETGQVVIFVGRGDTGTGLTGPRAADGKKRGATNTVDKVDDDWIFFDFDEGDEATDLEGVSGPGDSGGPALLERERKLYTLGVSVFADGKGKGPGRYGLLEGYTRVSTHRDWIESVVSGKSTDGEIAVKKGGARSGGPGAGQGREVEVAIPMGGGSADLPDSSAGKLVANYIETYNGNDNAAMSAFIAAHFAEAARARRTEQEHIDLYRRLYDEHFGRLTVQQVIRVDETGVTVLFSSANGPMAEFTFEVEAGESARIAGIRVAVVDVQGGR